MHPLTIDRDEATLPAPLAAAPSQKLPDASTVHQPAGARDGQMIRRPLIQPDLQKPPQTQRIRHAMARSLSIPSKKPSDITRKYIPGARDGRPSFS
jgi:hypothetical protein